MFGNRPRALVCYICGRESFSSLGMAPLVLACQKKWEIEQMQKPPRERRPCPRAPPGFAEMISGKKGPIKQTDLDRFNQQSNENYRNEECQYCGRKFKPESLVKHQKLCMKDPGTFKRTPPPPPMKQQDPALKVPSKGYDLSKVGGAYEQVDVKLVLCSRCGRKFAEDRIGKHQKACKGPTQKKQQPKITQPSKGKKDTKKKGDKPLWKVQHEEFVEAMKQMRLVKKVQQEGGDVRSIPVAKGNYDHYTLCQYCGRKFAPDVAERHIPKCANIINKPGGIQKSQIGNKYIAGSGVGHVATKPKSGPLKSPSTGGKGNPNFGKMIRK